MPFLLALVVLASGATSPSLYGSARAGDGDSLIIGMERIRLHGIDAPELDQACTRDGRSWACGEEATEQLRRLLRGDIRCHSQGTDQHGRTLARCYQGSIDINRSMVESGYALAYRKYSTEFVAVEEQAKAAKRGIWAGTFEVPSVYRQEDRPAARPGATRRSASGVSAHKSERNGGCAIKGNHSRRGEWIYHLPGMPYYAQTRPEATFCTEAQAQAAGYRRARVR